MKTVDERIEEQFLDWGLGERRGEQAPPDRTTEILAAWQGDEEVRPRTPMRWAAAVLLFAVGAVVLAFLFQHEAAEDPQANRAPMPEPVSVSTVAEIQALPLTTRAVRCTRPTDAAVKALLRLRNLERLELRNSWRMKFGSTLKMAGPHNPTSITDAAFRDIGSMSKLRLLEVTGCYLVSGVGLRELVRLPVLEELMVRFSDTEDAPFEVLAKLTALRRLDVSFNYGFNRIAMKSLLACSGLSELRLMGCAQIWPTDIAALHQFPRLEVLDLSHMDTLSWRYSPGPDTPRSARLQSLAGDFCDRERNGVRNATLAALAKSPRLRVLRLGPGQRRFSGGGLAALGELRSLRELSLEGLLQLGDDYPRGLPAELRGLVASEANDAICRTLRESLVMLETLEIAASYNVTDAGLRELLRIPSLRSLSVRQCRGLTDAAIDEFVKARKLRELDLRHIDWVTAAHVARIRRANPEIRIQFNDAAGQKQRQKQKK